MGARGEKRYDTIAYAPLAFQSGIMALRARATDVQRQRLSRNIVKIDRDRRTDAVREQSEQRLALALDAVGGGVFDWRIPTDEWVRSDSWYELTGFGREELAAWESEHGSIIHPDDVDGMEEAFQRHVRREADR